MNSRELSSAKMENARPISCVNRIINVQFSAADSSLAIFESWLFDLRLRTAYRGLKPIKTADRIN